MLKTVDFDTPYGPAHVTYHEKDGWFEECELSFVQAAVQCPDHIVWDKMSGKWYPEPQVIDYVLPRARGICQMLGIPPYEWLHDLRREDVWAIEQEYDAYERISEMMEYTDS